MFRILQRGATATAIAIAALIIALVALFSPPRGSTSDSSGPESRAAREQHGREPATA